MKALITGGAGFIGSHLAEYLIRRGDHVAILDDLSTGRLENISALQGHPRFQCRIGSVTDERTVAEMVEEAEIVYHLAAAVGVFLVVKSPVRTIETNVLGTEIVLRQAAAHRTKIILVSTSEVYGKSRKVPYSEGDDLLLGPPTKGRWSYACSKALEEFLALAYWREKKLPVVIVRPFNVVGPRQTGQYGMVLPRFIAQALQGGPITVYGTGNQTRSFAHVSDVVEALVCLSEHPDAVGEIYNIGSDHEISIKELAQRVVELAKTRAQIQFIPYSEAYAEGFEDLERRVPDLSKIRAAIGYHPKVSLDQIIIELLALGRAQVTNKTEHANVACRNQGHD